MHIRLKPLHITCQTRFGSKKPAISINWRTQHLFVGLIVQFLTAPFRN